MTQDVVPILGKALNARTAGWKHRPEITQQITMDSEGVSVHAYPTGPGAKYWRWVSRGVVGHPIRPRRVLAKKPKKLASGKMSKYRAALRLVAYKPYTLPGNVYGRAAARTFSGYRQYIPWWPGIAPRNFEYYAGKDAEEPVRRVMENIMRRAVRAAKREARRTRTG